MGCDFALPRCSACQRGSLRHAYTRRPKHFVAPTVAPLKFFGHHAGLNIVVLRRAERLMKLRIETLARTIERSYPLSFKHSLNFTVKRPHSL